VEFNSMAVRHVVLGVSTITALTFLTTHMAVAAQQRVDLEPASALAIQAGRGTFEQFCAPCHGVDGKGHGVVTPILAAQPPDLTTASRRNRGAFPLDALEAMLTNSTDRQPSAHRSGQMPIWGSTFRAIDNSPTLARARIANLLAYLESIQE
jgi:mono/diheme cytochrome c family protein